MFDYPGGYAVKADGTALSRLRMEETETGYDRVEGTATYRGFHAGGKIVMTDHAVAADRLCEELDPEFHRIGLDDDDRRCSAASRCVRTPGR